MGVSCLVKACESGLVVTSAESYWVRLVKYVWVLSYAACGLLT